MKKRIIRIIAIILTILVLLICLFKMTFKFTLNGKSEVNISYNEKYIEKGATVKVLFFDLSEKIKVSNNIDITKIGSYRVKYHINLLVFPFSVERIVNVVDLKEPTITLNGQATKKICPNAKYDEEGYVATDEYEGDLTDKVIIVDDSNNIKYKVSDSSGNTTIVEREIIREDKDKPSIKLNSGTTIYLKEGSKYKEYGFSASDNCDGNLTNNVKVTGVVDPNTVGTYYMKYEVTDSSNNKVTVTRKVIVNEDTTSKQTGIPGVIYLTFDDGPKDKTTTKILDVLKANDVKATFFITGNGKDEIIKRAHNEGHAIALHTFTHDYKSIYSSVDNYFSDLSKIQNRVSRLTGKTTTIMRFPGGSTNTVSNNYQKGIMKTLRTEVTNRGFTYFDWNVDASDAGTCAKSKVKDKKTCVYNNVIKGLSKSRPNVVLMHDVKSYTADALQDIINYGKEKGYTFLPIDDTTSPVKFK